MADLASSFGSGCFFRGFLALPGGLLLLSRREVCSAPDEGRLAVLLGGVVGTFSVVFDEEACVGRIIRAKKLSSTGASFFVTGWSTAFLGGGPKLGRGRLMVEL